MGTDGNLANNCAYWPVSPSTLVQSTASGDFTATVSVPVPVVNDSALRLSSFAYETILCASTTGVQAMARNRDGVLFPSIGDGNFRVELPAGHTASEVRVITMDGCCVWHTEHVPQEVHLPSGLSRGSYVVHITDAAGENFNLRYQLEQGRATGMSSHWCRSYCQQD